MTVRAWRIVKAKHAATAFSGDGAEKFGGRWTSPGVAAVYTAGSVSLAMLELLVHLRSRELLQRYVIFEVTFAQSFVTRIDPRKLPRIWRSSPPPPSLQQIGDDWIDSEDSAVLCVPSAVAPGESNYLLNPAHHDFRKVTVGPKQPAKFDRRLIKITR